MEKKTKLSRKKFEEAIRSGQRSIQEHEAFATENVQLAFGRRADGRISHVSNVDRGLKSKCFCPACSERLIARQGKKKAWHFAHSDGHACRDALSATLASWLAQCLNDGMPIRMPAINVRWGQSTRAIDTETEKRLSAAEVKKMGQGDPYRILARDPDNQEQVCIVFRTTRSSVALDENELRVTGYSTLIIDAYEALAEYTKDKIDPDIEEDWLTNSLLKDAGRKWLWHVRSQAEREALIEDRLKRHLSAAATVSHPGNSEISLHEANLDRHGLLHLIETPPVRGERFLGPSPRAWRAAIACTLVLEPFSNGAETMLMRDAAFGRRKIIATIAQHGLIQNPDVMQPLNADDHMELLQMVPDLRRPIEIIEDYLVDLVNRGMLMISPRKARQMQNTKKCQVASFLDTIKDADWISAEKISTHAIRVAKAERLIKQS
jgi:hypothetical protein